MSTSDWHIIDTHAHLDADEFEEDRDEVIARARAAGVRTIITVGTGMDSSGKAIALAETHPGILATAGFDPYEASGLSEAHIAELAEIAGNPNVVAIGEIGLDYYRDYAPREAQQVILQWQLELATELELPVVIHCREAEPDMMNLLEKWVSANKGFEWKGRGVIHRFSGSEASAKRYLEMGFYLSIGAYIGYPSSQNLRDVIREIPEDRLLVETDCPYLPPQKYRGQRNEPAYLPLTVEVLAEIRREPAESVARYTTRNARRLFKL